MKKLFILTAVTSIYFFSYTLFAYQVIKVKNKKVLIQFSADEDLQTNDTYYVINNKGKKKAVVSILKVKGGKAIAKILAGKAREGWSLRFRKKGSSFKPTKTYSSPSAASKTYSSAKPRTFRSPKLRAFKSKKLFNHLSFVWGYGFNNLSIKSIKHSDTSIFNFETSTTLFLPKNPIFGLRILSGTERFNIKGKCPSSESECKTSIIYLSGGALAVVRFPINRFTIWGGFGLKLLMPISNKVTKPGAVTGYIDKSSIKIASSLVLSGGLIFNLSRKFSIPFNATYTRSPSSKSVKTPSSTHLQTGLVYHF